MKKAAKPSSMPPMSHITILSPSTSCTANCLARLSRT
jgi:hypothetical protein